MIVFKELNTLAWNVHGVVNAKGRRRAKELVRMYRPSIFILLETHWPFRVVESFWQSMSYEVGELLEAQAHVGGIWILVEKNSQF